MAKNYNQRAGDNDRRKCFEIRVAYDVYQKL